MDFSIATWVIVAKKSISTGGKQSFITGKLNHNDAWPLVVLRGDGKLDILFGHNSEFEKLTTEAVIPHFVWTHIAIVVEQKKIKVFINGAVDCQANATKGNGRAVMFPLIIGSCPQEFRTRVSCVREGFDGNDYPTITLKKPISIDLMNCLSFHFGRSTRSVQVLLPSTLPDSCESDIRSWTPRDR